MKSRPSLGSERGAVLIQTAVAAFVLVGFGAFVVDYGILWVGRHQAQNAADAGAMAGALARAYEDFDDPPDAGGVADQIASQVASSNLVWGETAPNTAAVASFPCPADVGGGRCVRVDVHRNGEHGSASLPTLFGSLLGIGSQRVKATATAQALVANSTNCLRPWAIPDSWTEGVAPADFKKYNAAGVVLDPHDDYTPPSPAGPGTGLRFATGNTTLNDFGSAIALSLVDLTVPANPILRGSIVPLELTGGYFGSLNGCNGQVVTVGDQIRVSNMLVANLHFNHLESQDPAAVWNPATNTIDDSCAPGCASVSPRLVPVAVFDVEAFQLQRATGVWSGCSVTGGSPCVKVVNIVGMFIADSAPTMRVTSFPGLIPAEAPKLTAESSFLKAVTLVR